MVIADPRQWYSNILYCTVSGWTLEWKKSFQWNWICCSMLWMLYMIQQVRALVLIENYWSVKMDLLSMYVLAAYEINMWIYKYIINEMCHIIFVLDWICIGIPVNADLFYVNVFVQLCLSFFWALNIEHIKVKCICVQFFSPSNDLIWNYNSIPTVMVPDLEFHSALCFIKKFSVVWFIITRYWEKEIKMKTKKHWHIKESL